MFRTRFARFGRPVHQWAFTLVELLVVIAIIGILVALLLPAIQAAREAARRIGCQNNLHNLAIAVMNYENSKKALPPAVEVAPSTGEIWGSSSELDLYVSWIVRILPQMEDQALADKFEVGKRLADAPVNQALRDKGNPQETQSAILLCPSDTSRGRLYDNARTTWNLRFAKGNYAAYVSPEHIRSMRVFPGAMINEPQSLSRIDDGTSKTLMLAEVRTFDSERDSRGVWAAAWAGGSLLGFDMHSRLHQDVSATSKRNSPYSPFLYGGVEPGLPPNCEQNWGNVDWIRDCNDPGAAGLDKMPCTLQTGTRSSGASRSQHTAGVNAAHVDGSVIFIANEIDQFLMARMVSVNDGEGELEGQKR